MSGYPKAVLGDVLVTRLAGAQSDLGAARRVAEIGGIAGESLLPARDLAAQLENASDAIESARRILVMRLRESGRSWAEVGAVLRTTRQAAQQRYGR